MINPITNLILFLSFSISVLLSHNPVLLALHCMCFLSLLFSKKENILTDKPNIKIDNIKIVDFDKEKMNEKIRSKIMEKRGMKNIKVKFFD